MTGTSDRLEKRQGNQNKVIARNLSVQMTEIKGTLFDKISQAHYYFSGDHREIQIDSWIDRQIFRYFFKVNVKFRRTRSLITERKFKWIFCLLLLFYSVFSYLAPILYSPFSFSDVPMIIHKNDYLRYFVTSVYNVCVHTHTHTKIIRGERELIGSFKEIRN